jgi:hypothetical protein
MYFMVCLKAEEKNASPRIRTRALTIHIERHVSLTINKKKDIYTILNFI